MKIAVRLDDITPDMDWERFLKFKALLDHYQVKPLIGVVPDNRDEMLSAEENNRQLAQTNPWIAGMLGENKWEAFCAYLKQLQQEGWVLAMHGYRHIYSTKKGGLFPLNNFSEFAGLPYEEQKEMLTDGKRILMERGIETAIFMAPAHSYDRNTLRALKELGFEGLTDGFGDAPYLWHGLTFYPISFRLSKTMKKQRGFSTMVVHTGTLKDEDFEKYERYFKNENVEWISFEEYLHQPKTKRSFMGATKEYLMAKGKFLIATLKN